MAGQGRSTDSFKRTLHFDGSLDVMNGNELPQQRVSTSALDYHGGSFMSLLLEPSPPQSPTQVSTPAHRGSSRYTPNTEFGQNQASQGLINMHGSLQIETCSSSQVHPHLTRTRNEPFCSCQSAAFNYMDYEYSNNNHITRFGFGRGCYSSSYGFGRGGYSSSFHRNMTVGGSVASYEQAAENCASTSGEGLFGRTGRTGQATSVERTPTSVMCSGFSREHHAATPLPSFFTMNYRDEQMSQVPPVNNVIERHSFPWTNNSTANPQQYAQQPSLFNQHLQNLRNFALKLRDDIDRTIQTQAALEPIRCPLLDDDDEEIETEDETEDEDEDEDEDMDTDEDSNAGNTDLQDDDNPDENDDDGNDNGNEAEDQNRNEETTGNANVNAGPVVDNTVAMQEEDEEEGGDGRDGLEVEDILAGLSMESYQPQPQPQPHSETEPPCCSICLGGFQEGERLGILDCEHKFHYICVGEWLTTKNSCPLCRKVGLAI